MIEPYLVGLGGVVGAYLRYVVSENLENGEFPMGTFTVNILGSFVMGLITFLGVANNTMLLLGVGVCGSFTTFSTFSVDTVQLWESKNHITAVLYAVGNLFGAIGAIGIAWVLVSGFSLVF